jgi:hypothetical protein
MTETSGATCSGSLKYPLEDGSLAFANALLLIAFPLER